MNWMDQYRSKLQTAEEALRLVRSGDRVWVHPGCATPETLVEALTDRADELRGVEVAHMLTLGRARYTRPEFSESFRHNGLFLGGNVREAVGAGRADYVPIHLSDIEGLLTSGAMPLDVVLLTVSPPDAQGYLSLGTGVEGSLTAAECARHIIVEVDSRMPRTMGDTFLHVSQVAAIVETARPLEEIQFEAPSGVQERIADNVANLIEDGSCLQLGIGGIPDAVLKRLKGHKDLGIHSEMVSDGVIDLIEAGVLNGRRKATHRGKVLVGFVLGTRRLFDYINDSAVFEFGRTRYVNDPFLIAQNERMVAINSALQVDLTGQVCADSLGTKPYSGVGGQVDFIRGAARSKGGKPVIALPATAKGGTVSRIAPVLDAGAGVVTSRADVHYVVTEFGVAYLHGRNLRQRAEALIAIADPRFRDELADFACRAHYLEPTGALVN
jgi:acyl-CoA hydrolase